MKNKFLVAMIATVALFATSCQEKIDLGADADETSVVSFSLTTPEISTRAYGDGTAATVLQYAVYDANGNELEGLTERDGNINMSTTVNLKLSTGDTYSIIFWAAADGAPYEVDFERKTMTVDYDEVVCNSEKLDAFYACHTFTVTGAQNQTESVSLMRPFAQLNIGVSDYEDSVNAGYVPTQSKVIVKQVYSILDLVDGTVYGETDAVYAMNDIPTNEIFPIVGNEYLAMCYLLVPADNNLVDIEFTHTNGSKEKTYTVAAVPVQRNYRTNIIGKLLTSPATFNITVDADFTGNYVENPSVKYVTVMNAQELQTALSNAQAGFQTIITFGANITGNVTAPQLLNADVVVDGAQYNYDGQITINGNSRISDETLAFRNINFTTSTPNTVFIWSYDSNAPVRYAHNVTIDKCTFMATGEAVHTVVGAKFLQAMDITMTNCIATDMHTIFQSESCNNGFAISLDNVTTINCKNSVSFNNTQNASISNSTLQSVGEDGYGVRSKGEVAGYSLTVANCNISAFVPVLVRNMTANGYSISLLGNNTLTTSEQYQVVISNNDYSIVGGGLLPLVAPTGTYTLTGASGFIVYPAN